MHPNPQQPYPVRLWGDTPQQSIPPAPKSPWPEGPEVKGFKVNTWDVEKPHTAGEQKCP